MLVVLIAIIFGAVPFYPECIPLINPSPLTDNMPSLKPFTCQQHPLNRGTATVDPLASTLAPHLDGFDREAALVAFSPRREPIGHAVEEFLGRLSGY